MKTSLISAMDIINESEKLEASNSYSINHYMVSEHGIDWDEYPAYVEIAEGLEATMQLVKYDHPNGYTINEWMSKDL